MDPTVPPQPAPRNPKWMTIVGWVLTGLLVAFFVLTVTIAFKMPAEDMKKNMEEMGWDQSKMQPVFIAELIILLLYLVPQTSVLGAILLAAYLGGATATHVRVGQPFFMPVIVGVVAWAALFFREPRLRALIPWQR